MDESIKCIVENNIGLMEIINILIATINVIAVIAFFIIEKKSQKKDKVNNYNLSWYKLIDIPERTKSLNNIVNEAKEQLEELRNSEIDNLNERKKLSKKLIVNFLKKIIEEKNTITPIMKCIDENKNKEISMKLNNLREFHDEKLINEALINNKIPDYDGFIDIKNTIIETYYKIGKNFLE